MVSGRAGSRSSRRPPWRGSRWSRRSSAPSSLAADAAERLGVTLVGFLRGDGFNVYAHAARILLDVPATASR